MATFASERGREPDNFCNRLSKRENLEAPPAAFFGLSEGLNRSAATIR
jgi:hypothetical protein